jgi:hypothetical protein
VVTAATVAVKVALEVPAATVTEAGVVTPALLLDRATLAPPAGAAALRVTVQLETPALVKEVGEQLTPLTLACACTVTAAVWPTPLAVAPTVAFWAVAGVPALAVKLALAAPAATVTDPGTLRAALSLESVTNCPPAAAALLSVTVQADAAPAANVAGLQTTDAGVAGATSDSEALAVLPFRIAVS